MSTEARHLPPSERARALVRGAYDLHIHVEPDVIPRKITDLDLAHRYQELGLAGFVLKSHYVPTAERAKHRANHARRISGDQRIRYAEAFMRALPQVVGQR